MTTAGFAQGLALLCQALREHGHDSIAMEDPGHPLERRLLENSGLRVVAVPVDEEGIDAHTSRVPAAVRCTSPRRTSSRPGWCSPRRRTALVDWARRVGGLVIEDDYDGEYWFGGADRPAAMQGLAPDHVVYGGSASKARAPGLRLGWLAVPADLMPTLERVRGRFDLGSSTIDNTSTPSWSSVDDWTYTCAASPSATGSGATRWSGRSPTPLPRVGHGRGGRPAHAGRPPRLPRRARRRPGGPAPRRDGARCRLLRVRTPAPPWPVS